MDVIYRRGPVQCNCNASVAASTAGVPADAVRSVPAARAKQRVQQHRSGLREAWQRPYQQQCGGCSVAAVLCEKGVAVVVGPSSSSSSRMMRERVILYEGISVDNAAQRAAAGSGCSSSSSKRSAAADQQQVSNSAVREDSKQKVLDGNTTLGFWYLACPARYLQTST